MSDSLQLLAVGTSVTLLILVFDLVRRKRLSEEYSLIWIVCSLILLGLSMSRALVDRAAVALGIAYGPSILLLVLILFVFVALLSFSVVVSRQRQQIERLIEDVALLDARVRDGHDRPRSES